MDSARIIINEGWVAVNAEGMQATTIPAILQNGFEPLKVFLGGL